MCRCDFASCAECNRLVAEPAFGLSETEMNDLLKPDQYIGRCSEQVDMLNAKIALHINSVEHRVTEIDL